MSAVNDLTGQESRASVAVTVTNDLGLKRNYNQIAYSGVADGTFYRIYKSENGAAFGFIGETTALTFRDDNINADLSDAPIVGWNPFDGPGNYPSSVSFFEQRLFFGGSPQFPQHIWGSAAGDYDTFHVRCEAHRPDLPLRVPVQVMAWDYAPSLGHYVRRQWFEGGQARESVLSAALPAEVATPARLDQVLQRLREAP